MYNTQLQNTKEYLSKGELIYKNFTQLVMQNYNHTRNVAWYAEKLKISNIHLCTTVKKVTGNTCAEIIAHMVIMDAKSQLKSTHLSIQEISNSLNGDIPAHFSIEEQAAFDLGYAQQRMVFMSTKNKTAENKEENENE